MAASAKAFRELAGWLSAIQEEERTGLARRLHDGPVQCLTALKMHLAWIESGRLAEDPTLSEAIATSIRLASDTIETLREMAVQLRPGILDLELQAALEWYTEEVRKTSGISCTIDTSLDDRTWPPHLATEIFRFFQESLAFIRQHYHPTTIAASLKPKRGSYVLELCYDGQSNDVELAGQSRSVELLAIRERALRMGAELSWAFGAKSHVRLKLRIPEDRVQSPAKQ